MTWDWVGPTLVILLFLFLAIPAGFMLWIEVFDDWRKRRRKD